MTAKVITVKQTVYVFYRNCAAIVATAGHVGWGLKVGKTYVHY